MRDLETTPSADPCRRVSLVAAVVFLLAGPSSTAGFETQIAKYVLEGLQQARREARVVELERRPALDAVARERAARVASRPHDQRLIQMQPIEEQLRDAGIRRYRTASLRLDMLRGYRKPAEAFLRRWTENPQAWSKALDPDNQAMGLVVHAAEDGWIILAAVLMHDLELPADLRQVEARALDLVNGIRREHGLTALTERSRLTEVARAHSEDMVRRGYFSHVSPEGKDVADRVRADGLRYRRVSENIQMSRGARDTAQSAVDSWMDSESHRESILDSGFVETGVGVAVAEDGEIFFTQVFMTPPEPQP